MAVRPAMGGRPSAAGARPAGLQELTAANCGLLRRARDTQGQRLADLSAGTIEGLPVSYVGGGVFDATMPLSSVTFSWR